DLARFGLAKPEITVELTTTREGDDPVVLAIGKPVPDRPDRVYVRQGDQDDVVIVDAKALSEVPSTATALRSQQVADIEPAAVTRIEIQALGEPFTLQRSPAPWELSAPRKEKADNPQVESFLKGVDSLQTSEFLEPKVVREPRLDPPVMTLKIWQLGTSEQS